VRSKSAKPRKYSKIEKHNCQLLNLGKQILSKKKNKLTAMDVVQKLVP
jgi:hypothetical protein